MASVNNSVVRLYQQWANSILCEAGIAVSSLEEFQSGALLTVLLDLLWPQADLQGKLQQQGLPDDLTEETTLRCIQSVLDYITSVGIRCQLDKKDVAHGDVKSLLDLLWILILHFTVHTPDKVAHQRTVKWGKKKILEWCGDILDDFTPDLSLNLTANLCQNNYLTKLISAICDVQENADPVTHLRHAFAAAEEQVGICKELLDAETVTEGREEEHSLLVYLALLRRKAKLLENLPPQWAAGAEEAGGWNLPPEAMQAMGIDTGDYVMYAIVEETYLPPNYVPNDAYRGFPPQIGMDDHRARPTAQISEINSSDEEEKKENQEKNSGAQKPSVLKAGSGPAGDGAFDEMGRLKKKSTPKNKRTVSFSDSMDSQEKMNQSYNNLLLSDSTDEFFDPMTGQGIPQSGAYPFTEYPSTTYTTVPGGFIVTSTMVVPPGHHSDMFYSYPYAGYHPTSDAPELHQSSPKPRKAPTPSQAQTPDIESAVNHSQSIRNDIQNVIAQANKSKDSHAQSSSSGLSDIAIRGSDNDASQASLEPFSSAPVSDEEGMMALSTSQSDQEPGPEMDLQQNIEHPYPRLTDDWMSSSFNQLLNTGDEVLLQALAKAGGRSGLLQVMEDPSTDPAVAEAIRQAISEQIQRQEQEMKLRLSETTNSNAAMQGTNSEPSRSSMEMSTSEDDNIDELLDLLEQIGQEGQSMRLELHKSYAREAYLQHEHIMEEDNMQGLMQRLTDEIQVLQDENRRMQKQIKDMRDNQRSDKVSIMNLMSTIEDLRTIEPNDSADHAPKALKNGKTTVSVSTMTDRRIVANTVSQTQSSISQMRDKVQQIAPVQAEKGTQVLKQVFQRSSLTSTQGLIKTRNAGIQARPMQGRFNVGLQVGGSTYRAKHVATQTGGTGVTDVIQFRSAGSAKLEDNQFSHLRDRVGTLEITLNTAQAENSKLTARLEEALNLVKENLKTTPSKANEVSSVESENQKLRQQLDIVGNEKTKLIKDLGKLQERSSVEVAKRQVKKGWEQVEISDESIADVNKPSRHRSASPGRKGMQSSSRPSSPSPSRPSSPSGGDKPLTSQSTPESPSHEKISRKVPRPGSAIGTRGRTKPEISSSTVGQLNSPSGSSPMESRESSSERSPTRSKEDITAKVQRELEKLFPRNRSTAAPAKNEASPPTKPQPGEVKPLLDAEKVKGMSVDELRKKRLAMLVDSYTSKRVSDILQTEKPEFQSSKKTTKKNPTEIDGRPTTARGRRSSQSNTNMNNLSEMLNDSNTQAVPAAGQLPPWAQRRSNENTNNSQNSTKYSDHESHSASSSMSPRTGGRKSPLPEGSTYSSPPWRPPGPTRPPRPASGHSDSVMSDLSSGISPQVENQRATGSLKPLVPTASPVGRASIASSDAQQDARSRARSSLQRRLKSHLTNMAASGKPQASSKMSNASPSRTDTRTSHQRMRSSSSSSSSSVSDLIASLKDRSKPLKTSSREDLRSSSPATISKVTSDGTYISISEISPLKSDGRPQSAGRRRRLSSDSGRATQTDTKSSDARNTNNRSLVRQNSMSQIPSPRDSARSNQPSPRSCTSQSLRHSDMAASQTDLSKNETKQSPDRWAEPKHHDSRLSRRTSRHENDTHSDLFQKRSASPRSQRIRNSLATLTRGHLGSSERLTRSTSDLSASEDKTLLNDPGNIRPPSPNQSLDSSSTSSDMMMPVTMSLPRHTMHPPTTSRLPPLGTSAALNQSFSMIRPPSRPPSRAAVFEEETDYVDQLIQKYTAPS